MIINSTDKQFNKSNVSSPFHISTRVLSLSLNFLPSPHFVRVDQNFFRKLLYRTEALRKRTKILEKFHIL